MTIKLTDKEAFVLLKSMEAMLRAQHEALGELAASGKTSIIELETRKETCSLTASICAKLAASSQSCFGEGVPNDQA